MKKALIIKLFLIIFLIVSIGLSLLLFSPKLDLKEVYLIEAGQPYTFNQLINPNKTLTIVDGNDEHTIYEVGNYTYEIKYKYLFIFTKNTTINVEVEDTMGPIIENETIYVDTCDTIETLKDKLSIKDASNYNVQLELLTDSNSIKLTVTDIFNNTTDKTISFECYYPDATYFITTKGFVGYQINGETYIHDALIVNKTYTVPSTYGNGITPEAQVAFNNMQNAARNEGINIRIVSGYRSWDLQRGLFEMYSNNDGVKAAETYSARPGHSEHQTGLGMDLNWLDTDFDQTKEFKWLQNNAYKYGYILRYPNGKTNETGYIYEPWHFRYIGTELAEILYNNGDWITVEDYFGITSFYSGY